MTQELLNGPARPPGSLPPLALAPMAGLTGSAFRRLVRWIGGCGRVYTELVSSEALVRRSGRSSGLLQYREDERPIICQIFGANAAAMADTARLVESLGFDGVDVNAGCPVPKIVRQKAGAALLRDPRLCREILEKVAAAVSIPVSMKMRSGLADDQACVEVGRLAEDCGVSLVTVHARTASQQYRGRADWAVVARVKEALRIPVFGNGDVTSVAQALSLFASTHVDGIMIGRGAMANPGIFAEVAAALESRTPVLRSRREIFDRYVELLQEEADSFGALNHLKQFAAYFTHGMSRGAELRNAINHARQLAEIPPLATRFRETDLTE